MGSLRNDIIKVSGSNAIVLLLSILNGFILPVILSINDYAELKTYVLYAGFIGFLHFGFIDGINIKYGGKTIDATITNEITYFHKFLIIFQFIVSLFVLIMGIMFGNIIIVFVGLTILPLNIKSFFLFFYQAVGDLNLYSILNIITPIVTIVITLLLIILKINNYRYYISANILGYVATVIYVENKIKIYKSILKLPFSEYATMLRPVFYSGFYIMLGNIFFVIFLNIGRWISKLFMSSTEFAFYSFGMSLIGIVTIFINAVTQSFYPHLSKNFSDVLITKYRKLFFVIGSFTILWYYFIVLIVNSFIAKYINSLIITGVLLTTIPGILIIQSIYVNMYKVLKREAQFLRDIFRVLIISILLSLIIFYFYKSILSIAISAVISLYIWVLFPPAFIKISIKDKFNEFVFLCLLIGGFILIIISGFSITIKIIITILLLVVINLIFYRDVLKEFMLKKINI